MEGEILIPGLRLVGTCFLAPGCPSISYRTPRATRSKEAIHPLTAIEQRPSRLCWPMISQPFRLPNLLNFIPVLQVRLRTAHRFELPVMEEAGQHEASQWHCHDQDKGKGQ